MGKEKSMKELPQGIAAIDAPFGGFPLLLYLIKGRETVLVDTGIAETPREKIFPYLEKHNMTPEDIDKIVITHAHHDHFGGNYDMYAANPNIEFIAHEMDYEWMEDHQRHFNEMYLSYTDQWTPDAAYEKGVLDAAGKDAPIVTVIKGPHEAIDLGDGLVLDIYHTGAHSPGEVIIHIEKLNCVITGDCIQLRGTMNENGVGTFPLFNNVERYIMALEKIRFLECEYVCTSHTGILDKAEAEDMIKESMEFVAAHQENILETLRSHPDGLSLHDLADILHDKYYSVYENAYQLHATTHAQCQFLKDQKKIRRVPRGGKLIWKL